MAARMRGHGFLCGPDMCLSPVLQGDSQPPKCFNYNISSEDLRNGFQQISGKYQIFFLFLRNKCLRKQCFRLFCQTGLRFPAERTGKNDVSRRPFIDLLKFRQHHVPDAVPGVIVFQIGGIGDEGKPVVRQVGKDLFPVPVQKRPDDAVSLIGHSGKALEPRTADKI